MSPGIGTERASRHRKTGTQAVTVPTCPVRSLIVLGTIGCVNFDLVHEWGRLPSGGFVRVKYVGRAATPPCLLCLKICECTSPEISGTGKTGRVPMLYGAIGNTFFTAVGFIATRSELRHFPASQWYRII
jgi:hypothetical protein